MPAYSVIDGSFNLRRWDGLGSCVDARDPGLRPRPILFAMARRDSE
jgi:hypothetical protein